MKVTAGVAAFPDDGRTVEDLIHSADTRLYHGKRMGGGGRGERLEREARVPACDNFWTRR